MLGDALCAFAITLIAAPLALVVLRHYQILDLPNTRSSHHRPVPRGGGLAIAVGVAPALIMSTALSGSARTALVIAAYGFGLLGFVDDVVQVPALPRLAVQVVVAVLVLPWLLSGLAGPALWQVAFAVGTAAWLVSYVNAFNFMDGIDGISTAQALMAGAAYWLFGELEDVPSVAAMGLVLAGASLAFAPFNFPRARLFLGDVGSYFLGGFIAVVAVIGLRAGLTPEAIFAPLALYLADTGITLIMRLRRREPWWVPHRDHTYQRLVILGWSHAAVTCLIGALIAICTGLGALSLMDSVALRIAGDAGILVVLAAYLLAPVLIRGRSQARVVPDRS